MGSIQVCWPGKIPVSVGKDPNFLQLLAGKIAFLFTLLLLLRLLLVAVFHHITTLLPYYHHITITLPSCCMFPLFSSPSQQVKTKPNPQAFGARGPRMATRPSRPRRTAMATMPRSRPVRSTEPEMLWDNIWNVVGCCGNIWNYMEYIYIWNNWNIWNEHE